MLSDAGSTPAAFTTNKNPVSRTDAGFYVGIAGFDGIRKRFSPMLFLPDLPDFPFVFAEIAYGGADAHYCIFCVM